VYELHKTNLGQTKTPAQVDQSCSDIAAQGILGSVRSHCSQPLFIARRRLGIPSVTKISTVGFV